MTDHVRSYRVEPDRAFADRLERELVRRLEVHRDTPVGLLAADGAAIDVPATEHYVTELGPERGEQRHRSRRSRPVMVGAAVAAVAATVVVAAAVARRDADVGRAAGPVGNGLIAFVGESDDNPATSDIYVAAPDGTGLRPLTSTPELIEYEPTWSPDGSRLAFVRTADDADFGAVYPDASPHCATDCRLVVIDPSTGVETFSADIPQADDAGTLADTRVPRSLAWSPDGRAIAVRSLICGIPGCGGGHSVIADLETGAFTTFTPPFRPVWSPDGEWLALSSPAQPGSSVVLVPADLIGTGVVVDVTQLPGVRVLLPERPTEFLGGDVEWMPDGSAIVSEVGSFTAGASSHIDVVTVADGERRTLIGDGSGPVVSPDGSQIAYSRGDGQGLDEIWVAASDGSNPRRVALSLTGPVWSPDGSLLLAEDSQGEFTVRPDGTDRTTLGIRDHTPTFALLWADSSGIDWQPVGSDEQ